MDKISQRIADEIGVKVQQVTAAVGLLDEGATVPFISRYRKEVTGSLDDTQMRQIEERLRYLRELEGRRDSILNSIREQDKLTPSLEQDILAAETKTILEDLYLPYKPKRRTKGQIAREAGLEPLADNIMANPDLDPEAEAEAFVNGDLGVADVKAALDGAKFILMERFSEDAGLLGRLRSFLWQEGEVQVSVVEGKEQEGAKFRDYFEHREALKKMPSHRALAIFRGRNEGFLNYSIVVGDSDADRKVSHPCESMVAEHWSIKNNGRAADKWLHEVVRWTWRIKLSTHLETELMGQIRERAEEDAIKVFASNLKDLLLAAPAGPKATLGLDPGLRTGVKVAVVDATGKVLDHCAIYPHAPQKKWQQSLDILAALCAKHGVQLISIGNGTASRETDKLAAELMTLHPELKLTRITVSEAGASVYSASEYAAKEFPDLDVTIRGAVSIARRLQDPLAELVKIEPKSIGVGQYQHDVSQTQMARSLDAVVEDCVNAVGVDLNTASAPLLTRVSGLNQVIANNIVEYRNANGAFTGRRELKKVPRLGEKTFEQAAGFLRVMNGKNPLDGSSVHPEAYDLVKQIAEKNSRKVDAIIGDSGFLKEVKAQDYVSEKFGIPTIKDIIAELDKPGRDPRPEFRFAAFQEGVEKITDLKPGMILEGAVTNVTNFGAFVDVGVHQDGLVHISALSNTFVKDPREVVKAGDIVKVKVMELDVPRNRIGLSMRLGDEPGVEAKKGGGGRGSDSRRSEAGRSEPKRADSKRDNRNGSHGGSNQATGAMAGALALAMKSAKKNKK